ncbi:hypothetical protein DVW02_16235 [Clostridium botulinum]|nr:hypothetical protein [Clostridium botulinum]
MLMYIFKNSKGFYNNYFKIYDVKQKKLKFTGLILLLMFIISLISPAPSNYLHFIKIGYKLKSCDNLYDYTIPLISGFTIIYVFYEDYSSRMSELITFYNRNKFNYIVLYRWLIYSLAFSFGSFVNGLIYYRYVSFLDINSLLLSARFIPNILFLCSLVLLIMTVFKNACAAILILTSYYCIDLLSASFIFKIFSIGANASNFYYTISPEYYILNRLILIFLSCIFVFISCKVTAKA